jgi:transketolase
MINKLKRRMLKIATKAQEGHIPSAFSILDIVWALYDRVMNITPENFDSEDRDRFILSKGHGCLALYAVLAEKGFITQDDLDSFCKRDSILGGHPDMNKCRGVEASTGSLGHGLPFAIGVALALKIKKNKNRVYVLIGDGEANEGSIWEAVLIASHHKLTNLTCIIDYNHTTDRVLNLGYEMNVDTLCEKFKAFGWCVYTANGHDFSYHEMMLTGQSNIQPTVVIMDTIKGKGIKRMENNQAWHHRFPTLQEYNEMITEL